MSRLSRRRFLAVTAAFTAATTAAGPAMAGAVWRGRAFGSEAQITLGGPQSLAAPLLVRAEALIRRMEALFSLHDPGSALARLNREGRIASPPEMAEILGLCDRLHRATAGLFDPTVQPLWQALAQGGDAVAAGRAVGWGKVRHIAGEVRLGPGQALTLNGIAQGFAADRLRDMLRREGYDRVLVDLGEFAALGGPWQVGIDDPGLGQVALRRLQGNAIATSSPGALLLPGGRAHILGPRGEIPLWSTISVEADSAALADGLSTALCLAPAQDIGPILGAITGAARVTAVSLDGNISTF